MRLEVNIENTNNAENFTVLYKSPEMINWVSAATVFNFPHYITGLDAGVTYQVKVVKNTKKGISTSVGGVSTRWVN